MEPHSEPAPVQARKGGVRVSLIELAPMCFVVAVLTITGYREWLRPHFYFSESPLEELKAFHRFRLDLVCIEAQPQVRQQVIDYFANHRHALVGKYVRVDPHNLYFQPMR